MKFIPFHQSFYHRIGSLLTKFSHKFASKQQQAFNKGKLSPVEELTDEQAILQGQNSMKLFYRWVAIMTVADQYFYTVKEIMAACSAEKMYRGKLSQPMTEVKLMNATDSAWKVFEKQLLYLNQYHKDLASVYSQFTESGLIEPMAEECFDVFDKAFQEIDKIKHQQQLNLIKSGLAQEQSKSDTDNKN